MGRGRAMEGVSGAVRYPYSTDLRVIETFIAREPTASSPPAIPLELMTILEAFDNRKKRTLFELCLRKDAEESRSARQQQAAAHHPGKPSFDSDLCRWQYPQLLCDRHVSFGCLGLVGYAAAGRNAARGRSLRRPRRQTLTRRLRGQVRRTAEPRS